jgi:hypothetical protein
MQKPEGESSGAALTLLDGTHGRGGYGVNYRRLDMHQVMRMLTLAVPRSILDTPDLRLVLTLLHEDVRDSSGWYASYNDAKVANRNAL